MNETPSINSDVADGEILSGFRLTRLEVFNWGTFDGRVWVLKPDGKNILLTGDIGSGKSTLVDAVTTLLAPAHHIAYNKAAGADNKERTLRSYVLGHYKSERSEVSGTARPVGLRDQNSYSVILGVFYNAGYDQTVTLAQVFWITDRQAQPARFFVCAERSLSIASDFTHFGTDISGLRKKLRGLGAELNDNFPPYGAWFRRRFGIENEQALELFHQTVSMKTVGNLTDFVRNHMLEPFDVAPRIKALLSHFDDLNRAHEAVLKAKRQVELLSPLVGECERYSILAAHIEELRACREALSPYFAGLKLDLLEKRIVNLNGEWERQDRLRARTENVRDEQRAREGELKQSIAEQGGDRIEKLTAEIRIKEEERKKRLEKRQRYDSLVKAIQEVLPETEHEFVMLRERFKILQEGLQSREAQLQNDLTEQAVSFSQDKQEHEKLASEIKSLKARRNKIPDEHIAMRTALCEALGVPDEEMPFAGELLQIRGDERAWEGAAERLMRNFGLSLLVPDAHYKKVAQWVDITHLKGRLVYFRVRHRQEREMPQLHRDSLIRKLVIKPDASFYEWLEYEIAQRFDFACCSTQEQFRREIRAITVAGQIKSRGDRHEKDDRYRIDDRGRYVLGWTNTDKIAAFEAEARKLEESLGELGAQIGKTQSEKRVVNERLTALSRLDEYADFRDIDWQHMVEEIARLTDEKQRLEAASDVLKQLAEQLTTVQKELADTETKLKEITEELGAIGSKRKAADDLRSQTLAFVETADSNRHSIYFERLASIRIEALGEHHLTVESCDPRERDVRDWVQSKIDAEGKKLERLSEKIIKSMSAYKDEFKLETKEVDASIEAAFEYRKMLDQLTRDDLPRFEARFKELLNENTIREVANFQSQLNRERETIKERIEHINESLTKIDYNTGRYIVLEAQLSPDADIRDFQTELRACTEGALTGSEDTQYSEAKFLQVKRIIGRFRGREGLSEQDRRWSVKVTDVRNWFVFAASERWREDNSEHEHYPDSGGKSGGQKEKLAYTILAASLAYQFGLEWGAGVSRSFRFVVIDEAFTRGSDESAKYGLRLFTQLNLQILIVTPLQKIHIIEPFVSCVGFVENQDGQASKLRNLTIEEYRAEKARVAG